MNDNWYRNDEISWYTPLETAKRVIEEQTAAESKKAKTRKRLYSFIILVLILGALVGTSLAFRFESPEIKAGASDEGFSFRMPDSRLPEKSSDDEDESAQEDGDKSSGRDDENSDYSEFPDNFMDFFSGFYTTTQTSQTKINIPRAKLPIDYSVVIDSESGKPYGLEELYKRCAPTVVAITGYIDGKSGYYWGTGMIISSDGLILTNAHVIEDCDRATVTLADDREFEAQLVGFDSICDIAVLKIRAKGLPVVTFGDSAELNVGQKVAAIGNPLSETFRSTLTDGIISAIERGIDYNGRSLTLLQTNTALNEGNSGGPLFNMYGQVVGITNMKMMSSYSSIEGIGFAIPSTTIKSVVNSIVKNGEVRGRTSIGITVGAIPEEVSEHYDIPGGLYVSAVSKGSDAEKQGMRAGDILIAVNGITVSATDEVAAIKDNYSVGDKLTLTIFRNGETFDLEVELMDTNDIYR